ncbi:MAG: translation elongation factor-like protein [Deltaproteobacteria bacterium]|nr:translation elongation factor-like protein [Deltaproteobacteria bacterium]
MAVKEKKIGTIDHYYSHLGVATLTLEDDIKVGDTIHVKGRTSDFTQKVESLQVEHKDVASAKKGDGIGLKVVDHGRTHDTVYKVIEGS